MKFSTLIVLFMGLLLWGCKTASDGTKSCTFSKSNKTVDAIVQADTRGTNTVPAAKTWYALSSETQPDAAGSDVPADDDAPVVGKALGPQWPSAFASFSEKTILGWQYCLPYRPPARSAVTPPPPQVRG